ncbi:MAG TPA: glycosyltransferase N-terminal domain-containing protein [Ignavibacteria bacterium]|jgi:3-deoxy-D-manno-octulosonic-acid transferase
MEPFWSIIYNIIFLPLFFATARVLSAFNQKIKQSLKARKGLFKYLESKLTALDKDKKNILIHCASLGEFEQAKPIIDQLDKSGRYNFIVSFFSPSGFNHSKLDTALHSKIVKTYLPFDTSPNVKKFVEMVNPSVVIFIKYDLWFNLLRYLQSKKIFSIVVNKSFDPGSFKLRFPPIRSYKKAVLNIVDFIAVTDEDDKKEFGKILGRTESIEVFGDTKYERIAKAKEVQTKNNLLSQNIVNNKNIFVVGSSWNSDEQIILPVVEKISSNGISEEVSLITIIAPHEPTEGVLENIEYEIRTNYPLLRSIRYSEISKYKDENVILIDCIGILMGLYKYAKVAYVGGGFQNGMHNVLEPAGYGIPVLFGNDKISDEGRHLMRNGGGIAVYDAKDLYKNLVTLLKKPDERISVGKKSLSVFDSKNEASKKISELINRKLN